MKIKGYEEFSKVNEELNFGDIAEKLKNIITKYYEKGEEYLIEYLRSMSPDLKKHLATNAALISILVNNCEMTPTKIKDVFKQVPSVEKTISDVKKKNIKFTKEFNRFLDSLAQRESSNNPDIVNPLGYIGKYQFGKIALKDIGKEIDVEEFRKNPEIWPEEKQDSAMIALINRNKRYLGKYYTKYNGKKISGIKITKSGMLAASHLLGASNVKKFLDTKGEHNPKDGFGTELTDYLKGFSKFKIDL
jgi:hypothetical protein